MNAIPYKGQEKEWDRPDEDDYDSELPGRPRRHLGGRWTALLVAVILAGAGFYAGVRVEKSKVNTASGTGASALAGLGAGRTGAGRGGFAARFGGAAAGGGGFAAALAGGNSSFGTVSSVNGNTIYVTETSGDTVKVKLSGATKITKAVSVGKARLFPGDSVVIAGVKGSGGTVTATTVTDSGSRSSGSGTSSSASSSTGSTSGTSAVGSLFSGG
jgi:hypothetical protein